MFTIHFLVFLQNVTIRRMVWTVENRVVTVATGNHVITWTEIVNLDVMMGCLVLNVLQVLHCNRFIEYKLYFPLSVE